MIAEVAPGADPAAVEAALDEELARFRAEGPTPEELRAAQTLTLADIVRQAEGIGGFGGASDLLATAEVFGGSADRYREGPARVRAATPVSVRTPSVGGRRRRPTPSPSSPSRSGRPASPSPTARRSPTSPSPRTPSSLRSRRPASRAASASSSPAARAPARLHAARRRRRLRRRPRRPRRDGLAPRQPPQRRRRGRPRRDRRAARLDALGARLWAGAGINTHLVHLSALQTTLESSLALFADAALRPRFDAADVERFRAHSSRASGKRPRTPRPSPTGRSRSSSTPRATPTGGRSRGRGTPRPSRAWRRPTSRPSTRRGSARTTRPSSWPVT